MNGRVDVEEAYRRIRSWYQANVHAIEAKGTDYAERSSRLIKALPPAEVPREPKCKPSSCMS